MSCWHALQMEAEHLQLKTDRGLWWQYNTPSDVTTAVTNCVAGSYLGHVDIVPRARSGSETVLKHCVFFVSMRCYVNLI
jgi:hypothetical protein